MSFRKKWQFAFKCMRYSYNLKLNLICAGIVFALALFYQIVDLGNGMGSYLLSVMSIYPAQFLYSVCGSQLVQSSPCKKALLTSIPTMLTLFSSILVYVLTVVIEGVRMAVRPETTRQSVFTILMAGILLLLLDIYVGIVYKYFWISMVVLCVSVVAFCSSPGFMGSSHMFLQLLSGCPLPVAIAAGLCLVLLGGLLQYAVSLLVYKKPISKRAIYGMLRQQA